MAITTNSVGLGEKWRARRAYDEHAKPVNIPTKRHMRRATFSNLRRLTALFAVNALCACSSPNTMPSKLDRPLIQDQLDRLARTIPGTLGACVGHGSAVSCVNGDRRFSMQSVMKLLVGAAVLDSVDRGERSLGDKHVIRREDLSLYVQPLAKLVGDSGFETTLEDLIFRAVVDSDSAATDFLIARLGGPNAVQAFLVRKGVRGVRIDRDERHLQTEINGLSWQPDYVDTDVLERAEQAVSADRRDLAYRAYQLDIRDTATPRGMTEFLKTLAAGELLSRSSTALMLNVMKQTRTFPNRLRAGAPTGWTVAHKTGTSSSHAGVTAATNDVGILFAPDGGFTIAAAFVGNSSATADQRAAAIAGVSRVAVSSYSRSANVPATDRTQR